MNTVRLGRGDLEATPACLGTMTSGKRVDEAGSHAIPSRSLDAGVKFVDAHALAREHGLTPTRLAPGYCKTQWQVAGTIIGVTSVRKFDDDSAAANTELSRELLAAI